MDSCGVFEDCWLELLATWYIHDTSWYSRFRRLAMVKILICQSLIKKNRPSQAGPQNDRASFFGFELKPPCFFSIAGCSCSCATDSGRVGLPSRPEGLWERRTGETGFERDNFKVQYVIAYWVLWWSMMKWLVYSWDLPSNCIVNGPNGPLWY